MDFFNCKALDEAKTIIMEQVTQYPPPTIVIPLEEALGRIAAAEVVAAEDIPPFDRSTVDGYAVRSSDTFGAGEMSPVWLALTGEVAMGKVAALTLEAGQAAAIPTGGMLPAGADAVVMLEHVEIAADKSTILVSKPAAPGENLIRRGEDIMSGTTILSRGKTITPRDIGALAACGFSCVAVFEQMKVAVISTGDELVDVGVELLPGQIRDINSYALAAMLQQAGCKPLRFGIVADRYEDLYQVLAEAVKTCQVVIVSGGSSVGARDHTVRAIGDLGGPGVLFHGIAVKPGKPTIFGVVNGVPVFGLPGHPVSAMTICDQIVLPAIAGMTGGAIIRRPVLKARMARNIASAPGRDDFIRIRLVKNGEGYLAEPVPGKSGLISTLLQADGTARIAFNKSGLYQDEVVEVELFE
ncbi:MAG: molybdopterin-binding protein [Negativicutes bacterium]|nr:molybdopterin-binding protein [Negativicutes bacterium]